MCKIGKYYTHKIFIYSIQFLSQTIHHALAIHSKTQGCISSQYQMCIIHDNKDMHLIWHLT